MCVEPIVSSAISLNIMGPSVLVFPSFVVLFFFVCVVVVVIVTVVAVESVTSSFAADILVVGCCRRDCVVSSDQAPSPLALVRVCQGYPFLTLPEHGGPHFTHDHLVIVVVVLTYMILVC